MVLLRPHPTTRTRSPLGEVSPRTWAKKKGVCVSLFSSVIHKTHVMRALFLLGLAVAAVVAVPDPDEPQLKRTQVKAIGAAQVPKGNRRYEGLQSTVLLTCKTSDTQLTFDGARYTTALNRFVGIGPLDNTRTARISNVMYMGNATSFDLRFVSNDNVLRMPLHNNNSRDVYIGQNRIAVGLESCDVNCHANWRNDGYIGDMERIRCDDERSLSDTWIAGIIILPLLPVTLAVIFFTS